MKAARWKGAPAFAILSFPKAKKTPKPRFRRFTEKLAATYSRGVYKTTTIGKAVFDGRVRNGNGSGHSFMATKKLRLKAKG